jgi:hypothetical protein
MLATQYSQINTQGEDTNDDEDSDDDDNSNSDEDITSDNNNNNSNKNNNNETLEYMSSPTILRTTSQDDYIPGTYDNSDIPMSPVPIPSSPIPIPSQTSISTQSQKRKVEEVDQITESVFKYYEHRWKKNPIIVDCKSWL